MLQRSPFPGYGLIQTLDNHGNSNYHGLALKATRRFSKGLTYLAGLYLVEGNGSGQLGSEQHRRKSVCDGQLQPAPRTLALTVPQRARFVSSVLYELPFGAGKPYLSGRGLVNTLVGGWQIGSIVTLSDGTPINVGQIGDPLQIGTPNVPDATGISPIPTEPHARTTSGTPQHSMPTNPELLYRFGNTGRNLLTTPGLKQVDFSLMKETQIREGHQVEFRLEAFNIPNHPNYLAPATDVRQPATFGKITSARTMRECSSG